MGRPLRIGFYSPYFGSTVGGGEKYLIMAALAVQRRWPEHQVELVGPVPADRERYQAAFGLDLTGIRLLSTNRRLTAVHRLLNRAAVLRPLRNRMLGAQASRFTRNYDVFVAMAYAIHVRSEAARGAVLCQFPYELDSPSELDGFELVVCQSEYVRGWVERRWHRAAAVVSPPVDVPGSGPRWPAKERLILSVGRFITTGHDKRQDVMVEAFKRLCQAGLVGWELHLAGSVHREAQHTGYFDAIVRAAEGYPVRLHPDLTYGELQALYRRSSIYWHAAGYGVEEDFHPEALEHFGMTTAEAMAHGAVPIAIGRGGQPEVVRDEIDGYLWTDLATLEARTRELAADPALRRRLGASARERSRLFSSERFLDRMGDTLAPLLQPPG